MPSKMNVTDPDSRLMKTPTGYQQSYNMQAVVTRDQVVVAADVADSVVDYSSLHPMLDQARGELDSAGVQAPIRAIVADAGYGSKNNRDRRRDPSCDPIQLIATGATGHKARRGARTTKTPDQIKDPELAKMAHRLATPAGKNLYARRAVMVEPVFGQIKQRLGSNIHHRGIDAVTCEWKMIATSHNLLKYWRRPAC
jgi:hypothetical protein